MTGENRNAVEVTPAVKVAADGPQDRRRRDRRRFGRFGIERRRGARRRRTLRTLLLAAAAMSAAPATVTARDPTFPDLRPGVSVSIGNVVPLIPPSGTEKYSALIEEAAARYDLDAALIRAVMETESAFDPLAVSPVGAMGLMQLMPALVEELGVKNPYDPRENVMAGAKSFEQVARNPPGQHCTNTRQLRRRPGDVRKYKGVQPFKETRNYVKKITGLLETTE